MTAHVAERAGAVVPEPTPLEGHVGAVVRTVRGGPEPLIPLQSFWNRFQIQRPMHALRPDWTIGADMNFLYIADRAGANRFDLHATAIGRVALIAHLCRHFIASRGLQQQARFADVMG